jgi:hypothetical protein
MLGHPHSDLRCHFETLTDPRRREPTYPLVNVVTMAICAVICGCDDFVAIAEWARVKKQGLAKFLGMSAGVPSHDRFNAIFKALKPAEFERCVLSWITALHEITDGQIIAIDGKTLARRFAAAMTRPAARRLCTWSAPGPPRTRSAWAR